MKIKALYKNKWCSVNDVTKCDDGVVEYQLEGVNGKVYSKHIKDLDMEKGEVTNPDGSITRFPGKEQLKKPLSKGISLRERWNLLKAKMNNKTAFQDMDVFQKLKEEQEEKDQDQEDVSSELADSQSPDASDSARDQIPQGVQQDEDVRSDGGDTQTEEREVSDTEGVQQPEQSEKEDDSQASDNAVKFEDLPKLEGEQLQEALKELGYSDPEIAYILHGHSPTLPSKEELEQEKHNQNQRQDQEGHELTLDMRSQVHDHDLEHKKKLHELELEYAKREKELRLKHLEEELAIKRSKMNSKDSSGERP